MPSDLYNPASRATKRYNLKLPNTVRQLFQEPYDSYLTYLLDLCDAFPSSFPAKLEERLSELPPNTQGSSSRWTLWVGKEIRDRFDERKLILAPEKTHGGFVELMLVYRNQMEQQNTLPPFDNKGYLPFNSNSTALNPSSGSKGTTSRKSKKSTFEPVLNDKQLNFQYPPLFNFGSAMTLNDPQTLESSSYLDSLPMLTPSMDTDMSFYSTSTAPTTRERPAEFDYGLDNAKKPRYQDFPGTPVFNSANTMQNFDEVLNGLANAPFDGSYASQQLAFQQQMFMDPIYNPGFNGYTQSPDILPDLGPFYQPVSFNIGDQVHNVPYGYIPNL